MQNREGGGFPKMYVRIARANEYPLGYHNPPQMTTAQHVQ
jgi:hypothetical protein